MPSAYGLGIDLGDAGGFSGFFMEDVSGIQTVGGRLAVGGNFSVTNASIGAQGPNLPASPSLVVKGNITSFTSGTLSSGNSAGYGVYMGTLASSTPASLDLRKVGSSPVDFDSQRVYLGVMSEQLRGLTATGSVSQSASKLTLAGSNAPVEVFSLTAAQASSGLPVAVSGVAADAYVILNVAADSVQRLAVTVDTAALQPWAGRVLINAYDAQSVQFGSAPVWSSLLALNACVCNTAGRVKGNVVARKWNAQTSIDYFPFVPKP